MYHILHERIKCSKCGSESHETVSRFNEWFLRCLGCGHEGSKQEIIQIPKGPSVLEKYIARGDAEKTF